MRLDDAAEKMDIEKWNRMEQLLDKYSIKPLVGVIPICKDPMMDKYEKDNVFWDKVHRWMNKGWTIALHGYEHVYCTRNGGINPVNKRSEFAGLSLDEQKRKIREGVSVFRENGIEPEVFYALLDQELEDDIENKYPVHKTSYVMSSKDGNSDSKAGRPKSNNPTENTIKSRNNNGDSIPTPSDK